MALAPSPTAAATRFIEPCRTSPAAKTAGTLVSKGSGVRPSAAHVPVEVAAGQLHVGEDEAVLVQGDPGQPVRRGLGTDEAEQAAAALLDRLA